MSIVLNLLGMALILALLYALCAQRRAIRWSTILKALAAQFVLALIILKVPAGVAVIEAISDVIQRLFNFSHDGISFVFGPLLDTAHYGFIFIIQVLCPLIFLGAFINILNYLGILRMLILLLGTAVGKIAGTSRVESFICVANMFLGQTESPLLIAKYLKAMTRSEMFIVVVAGMGSMSVSILGGYSAMGIPMPYLITACTLVPFGAIVMGKLIFPETETTAVTELEFERKSYGINLIDALGNGAMEGLKLVMAIAASLVAIVAIIALVNGLLSPVGIRLEDIFAVVFYPLAYLLGIAEDVRGFAAELLGCKLVLNEFVAFDKLVPMLAQLDQRTQAMLCVAIGGFANIGSMAICLSSIGTLCPGKREDLAKIIVRALVAAFCLNLFNAFLTGIILAF